MAIYSWKTAVASWSTQGMWGKGSNEFYGMAFREIERGVRRDDLWGRALANADGDHQRARGEYIELLADHMEREALTPVRNMQRQKLLLLVRRWLTMLAALGCVLVPLAILCLYLHEGYKSDWVANVAVRDYPLSIGPIRQLVDAKGRKFSLPTFQQYYEVAAGIKVDSFTEVQRDLADKNPLSIYMKYGEDAGGILLAGYADAIRVHSQASLNPPSFLEMIQDSLGLGSKSFR